MANAIPDDLITTSQAAKLCGGRHVSCVLRWIQSGRLRGWKVVGRWMVSRADVDGLFVLTETAGSKPLKMRAAPEWAKRVFG